VRLWQIRAVLRVLAIAPLVIWSLASPVLAQEGTPAAGEENPRIVDPSECQVEPRPVDQITQVLQLDGEGLTAPTAMPITPPLGDVVDPQTAISIKEAARAIVACFNAQDLPRAAALMTDNGLRSTFWGLSSTPAAREATKAALAATPQPRAEAALTRLIAVTDESFLPDGRVAAFVIIADPLLPPGSPEALLAVFVQQGDAWLLDDLIRFAIVPPAGAATATP
jgi:hypothetical protein